MTRLPTVHTICESTCSLEARRAGRNATRHGMAQRGPGRGEADRLNTKIGSPTQRRLAPSTVPGLAAVDSLPRFRAHGEYERRRDMGQNNALSD